MQRRYSLGRCISMGLSWAGALMTRRSAFPPPGGGRPLPGLAGARRGAATAVRKAGNTLRHLWRQHEHGAHRRHLILGPGFTGHAEPHPPGAPRVRRRSLRNRGSRDPRQRETSELLDGGPFSCLSQPALQRAVGDLADKRIPAGTLKRQRLGADPEPSDDRVIKASVRDGVGARGRRSSIPGGDTGYDGLSDRWASCPGTNRSSSTEPPSTREGPRQHTLERRQSPVHQRGLRKH